LPPIRLIGVHPCDLKKPEQTEKISGYVKKCSHFSGIQRAEFSVVTRFFKIRNVLRRETENKKRLQVGKICYDKGNVALHSSSEMNDRLGVLL
jgi:hypothetical protein